jgi:uncharacterized membrane protein
MATKALEPADVLVDAVPGRTRAGAARVDAIDMLRGLVIAFMVLDHVREFFHVDADTFDPVDPLRSYPFLFATRWITHLCAPTFLFLAGVSILFQKANGKSSASLSRFLLTRGLWLIFLDVTIVSFAFNFGPPLAFLGVIWSIGFSMVAMSLIARFAPGVVLAIGVAIIALYPFAVPLTAGASGGWVLVRTLLLVPADNVLPRVAIAYAAVPWLGVMCLGFGLGPLFRLPAAERGPRLLLLALGLLALFLLVRSIDGYGDPAPWQVEPTAAQTAMSFLNVSKYPPSLDYVCVTLGLSLLLFMALGHLRGWLARRLLDFGRTPLFTYVAHLYIAHGLMLAAGLALGHPDRAIDYIGAYLSGHPLPQWGFPLWVSFAVWLLVLAILVPLSHWFAGVKRRRRDWWLGYL